MGMVTGLHLCVLVMSLILKLMSESSRRLGRDLRREGSGCRMVGHSCRVWGVRILMVMFGHSSQMCGRSCRHRDG